MSKKSISVILEDLNCASCVGHVQKGLKGIVGIVSVQVDVLNSYVTIVFHDDLLKEDQILVKLKAMGYKPFVLKDENNEHKRVRKSDPFFSFALIFTCLAAIVLLLEMLLQMGGITVIPLLAQFFMSLIAQVIGGYRFYQGAWIGILQKRANMDTLIALSTTAAFLFSAIVFLFQITQNVYFETNVVILAMILLGRTIESRVLERAQKEMLGLLKLQPKFAYKILKDEKRQKISVYDVEEGDILQVLPREQVPVDGVIVEGEGNIDEKLFTGEVLEVQKRVGDKVIGGTLNGNSAFLIKCTARGKESLLGRMIDLVEKTNQVRPEKQKHADKIASIFVPIVLVISLLSFFVWWLLLSNVIVGITSFVAVLIIACPCALGLATPLVIMVTSFRASYKGILIKDFTAFEKLHKVELIAFDKTGTETKGAFKLLDSPLNEEVNILARTLAAYSHHPLAQKISAQGEKVVGVSEFPGKGIMGTIGSKHVLIGSVKFLEENGINVDERGKGGSAIYVGIDKKFSGTFLFEDERREKANETFRKLHEMGIKTVILSGDRAKVVHELAKDLDVSEYRSELLPEDKALFLEKSKKRVAMVGDGVNDALALSKATVGIAMGSSADVPLEAADIGIMNGNLSAVYDLVILSKSAHNRILINLLFAFIYNVCAIPIAFFGLLNPMIASIAMTLSSLSVVLISIWKQKI